MNKTPKVDYTIKTESFDEVIIETFGRTTEPIGLMMALRKFAHQGARKKSNA